LSSYGTITPEFSAINHLFTFNGKPHALLSNLVTKQFDEQYHAFEIEHPSCGGLGVQSQATENKVNYSAKKGSKTIVQ
jgi:hypothetical protein